MEIENENNEARKAGNEPEKMVSHEWNTYKTRMSEEWIDKEGRKGGEQAGKGSGTTADEQRMETDTEGTLNRRKPRERGLAAKERRERKGPEIPLAEYGREAGGGGKRWDGKWVDLGKGGKEVGKWTGFSHLATTFSHLGPDNSTQVVDFPHLSTVRLFLRTTKS